MYIVCNFGCRGARRNAFIAMTPSAQKNRRFALLPTLMLSMGLLMMLVVGSVMVVNWIAARHIVQDFAARLITRVLSAEERSLPSHLDAAVQQGDLSRQRS